MSNSSFKKIKNNFIKNSEKIILNNLNDYFILSSPFLFISKLRTDKEIKIQKNNFFLHTFKIFFFLILNLVRRISFSSEYENNKNIKNINNIFISHLTYTNNSSKVLLDNYFGDIPNLDKSKNLIIYIPHDIDHLSINLKKQFQKSKNKIFVINRHSFYPKEFLHIILFFLKSIMLLFNSFKKKDNYEKWFLKKLSLSLVSQTSLQTLSDVENIYKIINKSNCNKIFIPFEGFPWERLLIHKIKSNNKFSKIFGYVNYGIFENQLSLFSKVHSNLYPDKILTSGKVIRELLVSKKLLSENQIINIGSSRQQNTFYNESKFQKKLGILIVLEALNSEVDVLINLSLDLSNIQDKYLIYIKFHPLTNFQKFTKFFDINKNIYLFDNDYSNIKYTIFRGSTSIIESIKHGSIPLYFASNTIINLNPLYFFFNSKLILKNTKDFLNFDKKYNVIIKNIDIKKLRNHSKHYYETLKVSKIIKIMSD